ncbi:hypothetical protein C8Q74DRAFT_1445869 [Fomes fomentarius]|nr:hypothetical protein C8Q74DRAFT_1445869 [Fomes fomentarius]
MSTTLRYNLRQRAKGPRPGAHSGLAPPTGTLHTGSARGADSSPLSEQSDSNVSSIRSDARVRPGVLYSQAGRSPAGAYRGSFSDQEAHPRSSGTHPVPRRGQEARPHTPSSQPGAASDCSLSSSNKENKMLSSIHPDGSESVPTIANASLEDPSGGQWTEVRRKRRARSLEGATLRDLPPHNKSAQTVRPARLNDEQQRVVNTAEQSLSEEQRSRIRKRMKTVHRPRDQSSSRGEGPSTMTKGKTVDARNWGAVAIDSDELDPEAQRKEFDKYSAQRSMQQELGSDYDSDEQQAALDYWSLKLGLVKRRGCNGARAITRSSWPF